VPKTALESVIEIRNAIKNCDYKLPHNADELKEFCNYLGWTNAEFEDTRKTMFPTDAENAALSAKFMKMM
jgi:hypothetical protein